jgi:putative transposon-encoded protein
MVALKRETDLKEIGARPENSGESHKAKFTVIGEEMIEKEVRPGGNAGRVYLPMGWVGKFVKIIRIE